MCIELLLVPPLVAYLRRRNQIMKVKDNEDRSEGIRVFVYGTLKEGHGNHAAYFKENDGARLLGRCYISGGYIMRNLGFFPCVFKTDADVSNKIVGEVYHIDEQTLDALDCLEGHPNWYERSHVDTPWKKAWCYFMPEQQAPVGDDQDIEPTGCWNASDEEVEWMRGVV